MWSELTKYLDGLQERYQIPGGELQVYQNGELKYAHLFGDRTGEGEKKNLYWLYSMSKVYTATSAMKLIEEGKLHLEDKVLAFFPQLEEIEKYNEAGKRISLENLTIRHLLSMTGGLNYEINGKALMELREKEEQGERTKTEEIVKAIFEDAWEEFPGVRFKYSLCHDILGAIIEKVSGKTLDQYVKDEIFTPLEISDMGYVPTEEQKARIVEQYTYRGECNRVEAVTKENQLVIGKTFASGGAGIFGNLTDYMRLANVLCKMGKMENGEYLLKPETIEQLRENQLTTETLMNDFQTRFQDHGMEGFGYALGVRTRIAYTGNSPVGEFGWDGAAGGYVLIDPENKITIGYLQHVMGYGTVYAKIHPGIRALVYQILSDSIKKS